VTAVGHGNSLHCLSIKFHERGGHGNWALPAFTAATWGTLQTVRVIVRGGGREGGGGGGKFALVMYGCSRLVNQPQFVRGPDCDCSRCCGTPWLSFQHIPQVWWLWQSGAASICCSRDGRILHSVWVIVRRRYLVEEALLRGGGEDEGESGDLGRERRRGTGGGLEGGGMTHGDGV
jgi:hypothetical protein